MWREVGERENGGGSGKKCNEVGADGNGLGEVLDGVVVKKRFCFGGIR